MTLVLTLIRSMPASTRSWSTSFCAWITLLLLLPVFPDMFFELKKLIKKSSANHRKLFLFLVCEREIASGMDVLCCGGWRSSWPSHLHAAIVLFCHEVGSKALWSWRSHSSWSKCHKPHRLICRHTQWIDYRLCKTFRMGEAFFPPTIYFVFGCSNTYLYYTYCIDYPISLIVTVVFNVRVNTLPDLAMYWIFILFYIILYHLILFYFILRNLVAL